VSRSAGSVATAADVDPWNRRGRLAATSVALFVAALLWMGAVWSQYRGDPFHELYVSDTLSYHEWAERIVEHGLAAEPVFHQAPLFPLLVATVYAVAGGATVDGAIWVQIVLTALAIALLVPIGRYFLGSGSVGLATGLLALAYAPLTFYALKLLPVPLALCTQASAVALLGATRARCSPVLASVAGLATGVACLARSEFLLFVAIATVTLTLERSAEPRRRRIATGLFLLGTIVAISPATIHNRARGDRVLIAASAGENLFVGNQRGATGGHTPLHPQAGDLFSQRRLAALLAEQDSGRPLRPSQVSSYWRGRAVEEILADPGAWLVLELRKLGRALDPSDPADMYSLALEREHYLPLLFLPPLSTFGLFVLATAGGVLAWRSCRERAWPLYAVVAAQLAVLLAFFVATRIRVPFVFWLLPFAGYAVVAGIDAWRRRRGRVAVTAVVLLVAAGTVHWIVWLESPAREVVRLASVLSRQERLDESLAVLEPWIGTGRTDALALDQAGWVHQKLGRPDEAVRFYRRALDAGFPSPEREALTRSRLATIYESRGELLRAERQHDEAVRAAPTSAGLFHERGMFLLRQGRTAEAIADFSEAARLAPGWTEPSRMLRSLGAPVPTPAPIPYRK
jgi:tetratricopeptide (TPR) repeat protein